MTLAFAGLFLLPGAAAAAPAVSTAAFALPQIVIQAPANVQARMDSFDEARDQFLLPKIGATSFAISSAAISALPQGDQTPIDKVVLQAPGVSYDSAISNPSFHVRNEYANTQTRINGIMVPEGISALGPMLDTAFIGKFDLLDGALPAQYGLRTAGVLDIATKDSFKPGVDADLYGGSFGTISPTLTMSGDKGDTQYFFMTRYFQSNEGLENPDTTADPVHDHTEQGKYFGYLSTLVGDESRLSFITGGDVSDFQIPNLPGQQAMGDFGDPNANSLDLNEKERDTYFFNILALQTKGDDFDSQLSVFNRYATVHFIPDVTGDLEFNDVASDVRRDSVLDGLQFDASKRLNDAHTLRFGFSGTAEQTQVTNTSTVLPLDGLGNPLPTPETLTDHNSKLGWNLGAYAQDEWKLTDKLTLNVGLRFDQLYQFVDANQFSPRVAFVDKPAENTTLHAGYARYFTTPMQAQATPSNLALFNNTTLAQSQPGEDPVRPERAHYFDAGVDQVILPGWTAGADAFYKIATDQIDDGQFGQAVVLTQFNYAKGYSEGVEFKSKYQEGGLSVYGNFMAAQTMAKDVNSNEYLIDPTEFAYIANHYHYTDDAQTFTASSGIAYRWGKTQASVDGIYGSGLRDGFANIDHVTPYCIFNVGATREFSPWKDYPLTARLAVVNVFDTPYLLRSATGVGEFAPQYGQRRGIYVGLSQRL